MTFKVEHNHLEGESITLLSDGKVEGHSWAYEGTSTVRPDSRPQYWDESSDDRYNYFIVILNIVAKKYPEVYSAVYDHIQVRTESAYKRLAQYCKEKNNAYVRELQINARKFQIIE